MKKLTITITAIGAGGATKWTTTLTNSGRLVLSGANLDLVPFNGATYAVVVIPATTSDNSGNTLWTVAV